MRRYATRKQLVKEVIDLFNQGKITESEELCHNLLTEHNDDPALLFHMGLIESRLHHHGAAATYFLRSKEYNPANVHAYINLGTVKQRCQKREEADFYFHEGLRYAKEKGTAVEQGLLYAALGGLYINEGAPEKCIEYTEKALQLVPSESHGQLKWVYFNLALAHMEAGHWRKGFRMYHDSIRRRDRMKRNFWTEGETPLWTKSRDKTVAVYGEQGVGDEVLFASCLQEMADDCKHVIFECHPRLLPIMERSFPDVECHGTRKMKERGLPAPEQIEACIPIGSLPMFYRKTDKDFPNHNGYLKADPDKVAHYREKLEALGPGPYVGLAWGGGARRTRFDLRSIDLRHWGAILGKQAEFISIHYMDYAAKDAAEFGLAHWQGAIDDLDEQFALIKACDLIISVNQSLVHFSGSLGKKCWTLTPSCPAWRYNVHTGGKMVWYPSVRQYRQAEGGKWAPVIERIAADLEAFIGEQNAGCNSGPRPEHTGEMLGAGD